MRAVGRALGLSGHTSAMSIGLGLAVAGGIGALGIAVVPSIVFSVPPVPAETSINTASLNIDEAEAAEGMRRLIASASSLIDFRAGDYAAHGRDARTTSVSGELRLWIEDSRDPGVVNEDELLILKHAPLLNAVLALTIPPGKQAGATIKEPMLFSDDLAGRWRSRSDVQQAVVATDVTAMLIEPIGRNDDGVALRVRLTFARPGSDLDHGSRRDAEFVVRVREMKPAGAKGARD